jgi:hypothetical protein
MADKRPDVYWEGDEQTGGWVFRASALGGCERALVMTALEEACNPVPQKIQDAYDAGASMESEIIKQGLKKAGYKALDSFDLPGVWDDTGQPLVEVRVGRHRVRCHPDGIAQKTVRKMAGGVDGIEDELKTRRVVEAKFMREGTCGGSVYRVFDEKAFYAWQISVEAAGTELGVLGLVGWKRRVDDGADGITEELVSVDFARLEPKYTVWDIKARVMRLVKLIGLADELGLGVVECDTKQYPCPFYDRHDGQKVWEASDVVVVEDAEVAKRFEKAYKLWVNARTQVDNWDADKKKYAGELVEIAKEVRGEGNAGAVEVEGVGKVVWKHRDAQEARTVQVNYKAKDATDWVEMPRGKRKDG